VLILWKLSDLNKVNGWYPWSTVSVVKPKVGVQNLLIFFLKCMAPEVVQLAFNMVNYAKANSINSKFH